MGGYSLERQYQNQFPVREGFQEDHDERPAEISLLQGTNSMGAFSESKSLTLTI